MRNDRGKKERNRKTNSNISENKVKLKNMRGI